MQMEQLLDLAKQRHVGVRNERSIACSAKLLSKMDAEDLYLLQLMVDFSRTPSRSDIAGGAIGLDGRQAGQWTDAGWEAGNGVNRMGIVTMTCPSMLCTVNDKQACLPANGLHCRACVF